MVQAIQKQTGGAHGVLVTAVSLPAFKQALGTLRRGGTCVLNGLPPGEFPVSIFDLVLNGQTVRGSIVGTRKDLEEALQFAAEGKVKATIEEQPLGSINDIFDRLKKGKVNGRIVLDIAGESGAKKSTGTKTLRLTPSRELLGLRLVRRSKLSKRRITVLVARASHVVRLYPL